VTTVVQGKDDASPTRESAVAPLEIINDLLPAGCQQYFIKTERCSQYLPDGSSLYPTRGLLYLVGQMTNQSSYLFHHPCIHNLLLYLCTVSCPNTYVQ
jgi:hypothetical protein